MKLRYALVAAAATLLCGMNEAQAVTYDITTSPDGSLNSPISFSQSGTGTIDIFPAGDLIASQVFGALGAADQVTFTYDLSNFNSSSVFLTVPAILTGSSSGQNLSLPAVSGQTASFDTGAISVLAQIFTVGGKLMGSLTFDNLTSNQTIDFEAEVLGLTPELTGTVSVVPLPASLSLFLAALVMLSGIRLYKGKQA